MTERVSKEAIEGLRERIAEALEAARVTAVEALELAAGYVERGWTQGHAAVDEDGFAVEPGDPSACRWCMTGAMVAAFERTLLASGSTRAERVRSLAFYAAAVACLGREPDPRWHSARWEGHAIEWNDRVAESGAEVAAKLREAAGWVQSLLEGDK